MLRPASEPWPAMPRAEYITRLYECLVQPHRWTMFVEELAHVARSRAGALWEFRPSTGTFTMLHAYAEEALVERHLSETWFTRNPWVRFAAERCRVHRAEDAAQAFGPSWSAMQWPSATLDQSIGVLLNTSPKSISGFALFGPKTERRFNQDAAEMLEAMAPFLSHALRLRRDTHDAGRVSAAVHATLDQFRDPVWIVDRARTIIHMNKSAQWELKSERIVRLDEGRLSLITRHGAEQVNDLLVSIAKDETGSVRGITVTQPNGKAVMLSGKRTPLPGSDRDAIALTFPGERDDTFMRFALREAFSLSQRETAIAIMIADGHTVDSIAQQIGTSVHTIRTQVNRIMSKMNVGRQAEIVKGVYDLSSPLGK